MCPMMRTRDEDEKRKTSSDPPDVTYSSFELQSHASYPVKDSGAGRSRYPYLPTHDRVDRMEASNYM